MPATIKDVAKKARVSVATVSRALNGSATVTPATRDRVVDAASRLHYLPHSGARSLVTRRTETIGALLPDLYGEFFSELIRGVDLAARARGYHLLVSSSHGDAGEAAAALRAMQGRVDGLLLMSPHVDARFLRDNLPADVALVLLDTPVKSPRYSIMNVDNYGGAFAMVRHLAQLGHRRIALIAGPEQTFDADERLRGYRAAMAKFAPASKPEILRGDFSEESGYEVGRQLAAMKSRPSAVFAANDMMAIGCLYALREAGIDVPAEIALTGFDDIPLARFVAPALTTVRVNIADLGRRAIERLMAAIEEPGRAVPAPQLLKSELVVRASCGAPAARGPAARNRKAS